MSDQFSEEDAADFLYEIATHNGVAVSSVSDGTLLFFKRQYLRDLLAQYPDKEMLVIMVKKSDIKSKN